MQFGSLHLKGQFLGDDHLILWEGEGGVAGTSWKYIFLPLKMLEIYNLSSSGKKINNLTLTC